MTIGEEQTSDLAIDLEPRVLHEVYTLAKNVSVVSGALVLKLPSTTSSPCNQFVCVELVKCPFPPVGKYVLSVASAVFS